MKKYKNASATSADFIQHALPCTPRPDPPPRLTPPSPPTHLRQRRRVVDAIADHRDPPPRRLQARHELRLARGLHPRVHLGGGDADRGSGGVGRGGLVPRQHHRADAQALRQRQ